MLPYITRLLRQNIDVTFAASKRIGLIVDSLKNFARLDESEFQVVNIHEGIESALTLLTRELQGKLDIVKNFAPLPEMGCYPGLLNQVFLALIKNAIQACKNRGTLTITTEQLAEAVRISFADDGRGIAPEKLSHIFDFGFSNTSGERVKLSTGLATAYDTVQKHGGEIKVQSELGKGTTVEITLPLSGGHRG